MQLSKKILKNCHNESFYQTEEQKKVFFMYTNVIGVIRHALQIFEADIPNLMISSKCLRMMINTFSNILRKYSKERKLEEWYVDFLI